MDAIAQYKEYLTKPVMDLAKVLNKEGRKYRIEKIGLKYTQEIIHSRVRIKVDEKMIITSISTG